MLNLLQHLNMLGETLKQVQGDAKEEPYQKLTNDYTSKASK